jgi:hypothetical protein
LAAAQQLHDAGVLTAASHASVLVLPQSWQLLLLLLLPR